MAATFAMAVFALSKTRELQRHSVHMKEVSQEARVRCIEISTARTNQDAMLVGLMEMARTNREAAEFVRLYGIQPAHEATAPASTQTK